MKLTLLAAAIGNFLLLAPASAAAPTAAVRTGAILSLAIWPCVLVAGRFVGFV